MKTGRGKGRGPNISDEELIRLQVHCEDVKNALSILYKKHAPSHIAYAAGIVGIQLTRDAVHDAWIKIFRTSPNKLLEIESFRNWSKRVVERSALDLAGREQKHKSLSEPKLKALATTHNPPEKPAEQAELIRAVETELSSLSIDKRAVVILRGKYGYTFKEIGEQLDVTLSTSSVSNLFYQARSELRQKLKKYL